MANYFYGGGLPGEINRGGSYPRGWGSVWDMDQLADIADKGLDPTLGAYAKRQTAAINKYAKENPVWQQGAFTNISPPSRNAGFSFPPGEKNVKGPWGAFGQSWREAPGEKARPDPLTPQQVAVSNEIISRGHDPQHIYDIYSATTKVDAAGEPVLPLERVHSQKQQDLAGRVINESIAAARETRPELFTEPAASGEAILPSQPVTDEQLALAQGGGGPGRLGQSGALSNLSEARASSSNEIPPSRPSSTRRFPDRDPAHGFSNLPPLGPRDPGVYEPLNINNYVRYGEDVIPSGGPGSGGHFSERTMPPSDFERGRSRRNAEMPYQLADFNPATDSNLFADDAFFVPTRSPVALQQSGEQRSTSPLPPEAPQLLDRYGPGYWTNPDTRQVMDIESEMGPQYHSTIPMGYAPHDPNRQTGFFSNLGRRLMSGVTAPYRHFTDISDVPVTGSGIGAAASKFGPLLASAAIPGGGLFTLLSRLLPDSGATPYQQEGRNVSDISFGPKTAWLGADVPGGGYYIPNQKIDMAQLGGGRTPGGRGITVHTPEGLVDATYRVDPTGAASITSDDFGAPDVDYGDLYYGGADYEGLDTGQFDDIYSGEDWGYW